MRIFRGVAISQGYAEGVALVRGSSLGDAHTPPHKRIDLEEIEHERSRLREAIATAIEELSRLHEDVESMLGQTAADILAAHMMLLRDRSFEAAVMGRVETELVNAEHALVSEIGRLAEELSKSRSDYLKRRARDVSDVGRRVMRHMGYTGGEESLAGLTAGTVVIAEDLLPSDAIDLVRAEEVAAVTERGGETGHLAILARDLGIPSVSCVEGILDAVEDGDYVLVDAEHGEVIVDPTVERAKEFARAKAAFEDSLKCALGVERREPVTTDGVRVQLMANIGRLEEAAGVIAHNMEGVGLFRTELLYMESPDIPSRGRQAEDYRRLVEDLKGLPAAIRTFDLGGDKRPRFLAALDGQIRQRGLRFTLSRPGLLADQLAAIVEASAAGPVSALFPLVADAEDLRLALDALERAARDAGLPRPPAGAMIEMPSALYALDEIAQMVDYLSIGTNDLVQFMLAADRETASLSGRSSILHPSILRAVSDIIAAAEAAGIGVALCGEAAGDPRLTRLLIGLGLHELSMTPSRAARVRLAIRRTDSQDAADLARRVLGGMSADDIRREVLEAAEDLAAVET